jgi:acetylornithine deacetylase/succinyl-diaminopimelate desuccinylase-like protein
MEGTLSAGDLYHNLKNGIPGLFLGPGDLKVLHQANEVLDIDEMFQAARIYAVLILRMCR